MRGGVGLMAGIFLSKASTAGATASAGARPNWARLYSTTLGVRGGGASVVDTIVSGDGEGSAVASPAPPAAATAARSNLFQHLPGLEVRRGEARRAAYTSAPTDSSSTGTSVLCCVPMFVPKG